MLQGKKIFKEKMGENKKEYPLALLGFNMTFLYSRPHSSYQALYDTVLFSRNSWCFKELQLIYLHLPVSPAYWLYDLENR